VRAARSSALQSQAGAHDKRPQAHRHYLGGRNRDLPGARSRRERQSPPLARLWPNRVARSESPTSTERDESPRPNANAVTLREQETKRLKVEPVQLRSFREDRTAVGRIAFNDERTTSIFAAFQGRVVRLIAKPEDVIHPGSPLLIIDSPDLVQANADLIAASQAVKKAKNQLSMAERLFRRQELLYQAGASALKDLEQASTDFTNFETDLKTAEGQLTAARNRLRAPFGKSDTAIAEIEATHQVDRVAEILSPIGGTVTARIVSPGQFVRADNTDPLFSVGDLSLMWVIANVAETDIPPIKLGQDDAVQVMAYPRELFRARIHKLDAYGVTLPQILTAIGNANVNVGGRTITIGQQSVNVRGVGLIGGGAPEVMTTSLDRADGDGRLPVGRDGVLREQKLTDIENIVLGSQPGGIPILIRDVE